MDFYIEQTPCLTTLGAKVVLKAPSDNKEKMTYPLYQTLCKNIRKTDLTTKQKTQLIEEIELYDTEKMTVILLLIIEHSKIESVYKEGELPYELKQTPKGVSFDLENLPVPLKHILYKFTKIGKT